MTRSHKKAVKVLVNCAIVGICMYWFAIILDFCTISMNYCWDLYKAEYCRQQGFHYQGKQEKMQQKAQENDIYRWCYDSRLTETAANIRDVVIITAVALEIIFVIVTTYILSELVKFTRKKFIKLVKRCRFCICSKFKEMQLKIKKEESETQSIRVPRHLL